MTLYFKHRKALHYLLLLIVIFLQILIGAFIYNEIFNEEKLKDTQAELHISEQAEFFSDLTKEDYINAQNNLQQYLQTKELRYLINYNKALKSLNANIDNLVATTKKSDLFLLYLNTADRSGVSIQDINSMIDSLKGVEVMPQSELKEELLRLKKVNYNDILDSINIETSVQTDSIERRNLLSRLGNAISGKVDVQKEKSNTILTIKRGNNINSGDINEQLDYILKKTDDYYQKEFLNYKKRLTVKQKNDSDFIQRNSYLLNYSNLLLKKYNEALVSFTNDVRQKFQEQYKTSRLIRNYIVIGTIILLIAITIVLIGLTRLTFQYEKRLKVAKIKIQENLNFKNRMVGMISHEIRSPLNIISILSRNLVRQVSDDTIKESLKSIQFTSNSVSSLAGQILDFSKNENKKLQLDKTTFDLKNELNEITSTLTTLVEDNDNRLYVENSIKDHIMVFSDVFKIHQLFYNLIGNANKFTEKGNVFVKLSVEETTYKKIKLFVEIKDEGKGIDDEELKHIFKSYYQGKISNKIKNLGVGLGLNLCKELIELFEGEISITSKKNVSTVLSFNLLLDKMES